MIRNFHIKSYSKAIAVALIAMLIMLAIGWRISSWYGNRLLAEARSEVYMALTPYSHTLVSTIHRRVAVLNGLDAFVQADPSNAHIDLHLKDFISSLYDGTQGICYLALAPGGIIRHIYPPEHRGLVGRDLVNDPLPRVRLSVQQAIRSSTIFINGPYELKGGKPGLVAYAPIFYTGKFWGIATVVFDFDTILSAAGIPGGTPEIQLSLLDSREKMIYSDKRGVAENPVRLPVDLPGEKWTLAAVPASGWDAAIELPLYNFLIAGLVIIGLLTVLLFLIMASREHLQSTVISRTKDLQQELRDRWLAQAALKESEEKYRRLFNSIRDSTVVANTDRIITDCNPAFTEMFGYTLEEVRGKSTRILCENGDEFHRFGRAIASHKNSLGFFISIRYRKKSGEVFPAEVNLFYIRDDAGNIIGYIGLSRDISMQAAAMVAMKEREEQFQTLAELAPAAIAIIGGEQADEYIYVNSAWERLTGYSKADIKTLRPIDVVHPEMREMVRARRDARLRGEPVESRYEIKMRTKEGRERWIDFSATLSTYMGERVIITLSNDITGHKAAEEALRKSEVMYRNLFENAPIGIFRATSERFYNINPEMAAFLGCESPEQAVNYFTSFTKQLCTNPNRHNELIHLLSDRGFVEDFEFEAKRIDGSRIWLMANARRGERLPDGNFVMEGFAREITASRLAKERIVHLNRILRSMQDINRLIAREKDEESFIRQVCGLLVKNQGYIGALVILRDGEQFNRFFMAGMEEPFGHIEEMFDKGMVPRCCGEGSKELRDRKVAYCKTCPGQKPCSPDDIMCIGLRHEDTLFGYLAVSIFRGQAEFEEEYRLFSQTAQDVAFAMHNMERERQARAAESARERAEEQLLQAQKMEAIGRLAGGVAHDFNNMLNVILGYAGIIRNRMDKNSPMFDYILEIEQAARHSADLTSHLLAFSRKQITEPRVIDLNEIINEELTLLKRLIGEGIDIRFLPAEDLWNIKIDPFQIDQILTNLAVNSRDAIEGQGEVVIKTVNATLEAQGGIDLPTGDYVRLTFSDTGFGMDEQTLEQIFEPFFTTKEVGKGTGLGLSTVYGIVKQNRGGIQASSEPGGGTTFRIYFPRYQTEDEPRELRPEIESTGGNETVLIVEDEEQVLNLTGMILQECGYKILKTRSPREALDIARNESGIHLLLTDVIMPEMNGRELSDRIKAINPGIRTLFMSGYTDDVIAAKGIIDKKSDLIVKPFTVESLAGKIREALDREE